jgi:hypothetical protein
MRKSKKLPILRANGTKRISLSMKNSPLISVIGHYDELEDESSIELLTKTRPDAAPTSSQRQLLDYMINWLIQSKPQYLDVQIFLVTIPGGGLMNPFLQPINYILDRLTQSIPPCLATRNDFTEVRSFTTTTSNGNLMSRRRQPIDCGNCVIQSILQCLATRNPSTVESANTVSYRRPMSPPRHNILYQVLRDRRQTAIADRFDWMPDVGPDPWTHCIPKSVELVSYQNLNNITDSLFSKDASNALPLSLPLSSVLKRYFVKGTVKGKLVAALPDNGAGLCFISKAMVKQLHLQPVPGTQRRVYLAN